ncbi:MAG: hypothetical protein E5V48_07425 [Mesorhizobium sp.]|nr:MAG: hypothetical protein E5V48_07425 [Mesorhizobium sp.]
MRAGKQVRLVVLTFFLLPVYGASSHAETVNQYGYIHITLDEKPRKDHDFNAYLLVNGLQISTPFSHAMTSYPWQPLSRGNLNSSSRSTKVDVKYSFGANICQFYFQVEFSFFPDGRNPIVLGKELHAPQSETLQLPVGALCEEDMPVCSDDPGLKRQFEINYNQVRIEGFNEGNREIKKRLLAKAEANNAAAKRAATQVRDTSIPDTRPEEQVRREQIDEWQVQADQIADWQRQIDAAVAKDAQEEPRADPEKVAKATAQEEFEKGLARPLFGKKVDEYLRDLPDQYRFLEQALADAGDEPLPDSQIIAERLQRNVNFTRRNIFRHHGMSTVAKEMGESGLSVIAPEVALGVKACTIFTGRELCIFDKIKPEELLGKACKLYVENTSWKAVEDILMGGAPQNLLNRAAAEALGNMVQSGACKHVLSKK